MYIRKPGKRSKGFDSTVCRRFGSQILNKYIGKPGMLVKYLTNKYIPI